MAGKGKVKGQEAPPRGDEGEPSFEAALSYLGSETRFMASAGYGGRLALRGNQRGVKVDNATQKALQRQLGYLALSLAQLCLVVVELGCQGRSAGRGADEGTVKRMAAVIGLGLALCVLLAWAYYTCLSHWRAVTRFMVCEELMELPKEQGIERMVRRQAIREREQQLHC